MNIEKIKKKLNQYGQKDIVYCKPLEYLCYRNNCESKDFEKDLLELKSLEFVNSHFRKGEKRHGLYFVYSKRKGRCYVIKFEKFLKVVTIFPLGSKTIPKYYKTKFKRWKVFNLL